MTGLNARAVVGGGSSLLLLAMRRRNQFPKVILETGPSVKWAFLLAGFAFARYRCQVVARAFALIWSNSAWVIVPASRSCLADAI